MEVSSERADSMERKGRSLMQENKKTAYVSRRDFYVSVAMLISAVFVKVQITRIGVAESRVLPNILFGIMTLCGLVLFFQTIRKKGETESSKPLRFSAKELLGGICMVFCWAAIPLLGFYSAICLLIIAFLWMMEPGRRSGLILIKIMAAGVVTTTILYMCFARVLHIVTPVGIWI